MIKQRLLSFVLLTLLGLTGPATVEASGINATILRRVAWQVYNSLAYQPLPAGAGQGRSIVNGTNYSLAVNLALNNLKAAILASNWTAEEKAAALRSIPPGLLGGGGSGTWSGDSVYGRYPFCWTRVNVFIHDPWYVVRMTAQVCHVAPTPTPTPRPTPTP